ncbi:MAG TPA: PHP domain-containing protein, partial [Verrucomicrobiae bacterium]|nr:PHP domain-containing protein [Verrucomicrobiae bacterium]
MGIREAERETGKAGRINSPRSILHLDADAFFASVEQAADTRLRGKPVAVGGEKRGIIASASYEARQFGIYTPMPTVLARRLCPKLILVPGDFEKYEHFSRLMFSYAYDFTPDVEIGSIDEGYLDLTGARRSPLGVAETIRKAIHDALHLPVSEGLGANKLVSQIASKLNKPAAFQFVPHGAEARFLAPLANKWLPGVGPKTANQLNAAGLARVGQIARTPPGLLNLLVGSMAVQLRNHALGVDERPVIPVRAPAKSYGEQETFAADATDEPFLEATLRRMADRLMARARQDGKSIRTLAVKVRYNDMEEDQAAESLDEPTDLETDIYSNISRLLRKAWKRRVSVRLVSLRLSNVYDGRFRAALGLDVHARRHEAEQRLADVADGLRARFGRAVLLRGHDFTLRAVHEKTARARPGRNAGSARNLHPRGGSSPAKACSAATQNVKSAAAGGTPMQNYQNAIVQRQRLGNDAVRRLAPEKARSSAASPGPEFRFRVELGTRQAAPADTRNAAVTGASAIPRAKRTASFAPLNFHSYFSFLDSTLSPRAIVELAARHQLSAVALTDKNNLHGAVEFAQAAARAGIKAIIGAEIQWHGHPLSLYVQNQAGYRNLCRILSAPGSSHLDATEGLLALSPDAGVARFFPSCFYLQIDSRAAFEKYVSSRALHGAPSLPLIASFPIHYEKPSDRWQ